MADDGIAAKGTQFRIGDGGVPEVFTAVARVHNIEAPQLKRDTKETTAHDTPDIYRTHKGTLVDAGDVTIELRYDPSVHDALIDHLEDADPRNYQIVFPVTPAVTWSFTAITTEFSTKAPVDDLLSASVKFKVSGKPTIV